MRELKIFILFAALTLGGCSKSPEPINFGNDNCEHCKMLITDVKYGAELITDKNKIYKFDSVECLIGFNNKQSENNNYELLVVDFSTKGKLIDAKKAYYIYNDKFHSPMGLNVLAVSEKKEADNILTLYGGTLLTWEQVVNKASGNNSMNM